jgi:hypothetical protein
MKAIELNAITARSISRFRRRRGRASITSPARVAPKPVASPPPRDGRFSATGFGLVYNGAEACSVSVELTTPAAPATGVLKEQARPAGIVAGQENFSAVGTSTVWPTGVTVTVTLPAAFGASSKEGALTVVVNGPVRVTASGATFEGT